VRRRPCSPICSTAWSTDRLDGQPTLLVIDEGRLALDDRVLPASSAMSYAEAQAYTFEA
jgi:hypothetical protein